MAKTSRSRKENRQVPHSQRRRAKASLALWFAIPALVLVVFLTVGDERSAEREFYVSPNSTVPLLQLEVRGGYSLESFTFTVWPDGRLIKASAKAEEATVVEPNEVQQFASLAVNGGLMEWDDSALWARIVEAVGHEPTLTDQPIRRVTIHLDELDGAEQVEKEFSYSFSPAYIRHLAPEANLPEVDSLIALRAALEEGLGSGAKE